MDPFERASCGGPPADGLEQRIEATDDAVIRKDKTMALLPCEARILGDEPGAGGRGQGA
jgi:hypothetical protein